MSSIHCRDLKILDIQNTDLQLIFNHYKQFKEIFLKVLSYSNSYNNNIIKKKKS